MFDPDDFEAGITDALEQVNELRLDGNLALADTLGAIVMLLAILGDALAEMEAPV